MTTYYSFDDNTINEAIASVKDSFAGVLQGSAEGVTSIASSAFLDSTANPSLSVYGGCIAVVTENHKICLNLPLGLGSHCLPLPISVPDGTAGEACLEICTTWGIPTGVKVSVKIAGITVVSQTFGKC